MNQFKLIAVTIALSLFFGLPKSALSATYVDTLEDIGPNGTIINSRVIGGVTVDISTSSGVPFKAFTYNDSSPLAFVGAGGASNVPLNPANVSGTRFISTGTNINPTEPINFYLSAPVMGFGLTTLDLLTNSVSNSSFLKLTALDSNGGIIDEHILTGRQGPSGLDLDLFVSSSQSFITRVILSANISSEKAYGIDDIVVKNSLDPVPLPAALWLFGSVIAGLAISGTVKKC